MAIQLMSNTLLQASHPPTEAFNTPLVPLTIFDKVALDLHVSILCGFETPMPSNEVLKSSLSTVLTHFPHFAGRFTQNKQGQPCIALNNAGIRIIETFIPAPLSDYLPFDPSMELSHLSPPVEGVNELFQVQLNRYKCGGLVIGFTSHHRVADGHSVSSFLAAWTRVARGLDIEPPPCHDRDGVFFPRNPPKVDFDHYRIEFNTSSHHEIPSANLVLPLKKFVTFFSMEFINRIKERVVSEDNSISKQRYSSYDCLLAHLWKKITHARGLQHDEFTQVRVAVDGRRRIKPQVRQEYFGNLVLFAYPKLTVREVLKETHAYVVKVIHNAIAAIDENYFQSFVDFGELTKRNNEKLESSVPEVGNIMSPNLEADSMLRFNIRNLDFGGGSCVFYFPDIPVEGVLMLLPSFQDENGVDVVMSLLPEQAHLFHQDCYSLDYHPKI